VDLDLTHRKSYGHVETREEAMAAFKVYYLAWKSSAAKPTSSG
jgi:hypothetical protein